MDADTIGAEEFCSRFRALCRGGVGPGLPKRRRDAQIFLRAAATAFAQETPYSERAVGDALISWIRRAGDRIEIDHVTLRRHLVDGGYLLRDAAGMSYQVRRSGGGQATFDGAVAELDAEQIFEQAGARRHSPAPGNGGKHAGGGA